jgi:hypothetical protein
MYEASNRATSKSPVACKPFALPQDAVSFAGRLEKGEHWLSVVLHRKTLCIMKSYREPPPPLAASSLTS